MVADAPFLRLRILLVAVLALALVATGWAHRAPGVTDQALAFMAATGATPADFCGDMDLGGASHGDPLCQACQISGGADVPVLPDLPQRLERLADAAPFALRESAVVTRVLDLSQPPQGPPVV